MYARLLFILFLVFSCLTVSGCWDSTEVTLHQPGEYAGPQDDLKVDNAALLQRQSNQRDR